MKYLTVKEAAEYFGTCEATIRNWAHAGKIEARQPAGKCGSLRIIIREG